MIPHTLSFPWESPSTPLYSVRVGYPSFVLPQSPCLPPLRLLTFMFTTNELFKEAWHNTEFQCFLNIWLNDSLPYTICQIQHTKLLQRWEWLEATIRYSLAIRHVNVTNVWIMLVYIFEAWISNSFISCFKKNTEEKISTEFKLPQE